MRRSGYVGLGVFALLVASFGIINCAGDEQDTPGDSPNNEDGGIDSSSGNKDGSTSDASNNPGDDAGGQQDAGDAGDAGDGGDGAVEQLDTTWANWRMPNPASAGLPNPASYTTTADVVTDNVTGLHWQRVLSGESVSLQDATDYCANLTLAGNSDWRVPSLIELYSLVDFTRSGPCIDVVTFPDTPKDFFWGSTPSISDLSQAYVVNFDTFYINVKPGTDKALVRCVR